MKLRLATENEVDKCYQCIEDARAYQKSLGFVQWNSNYPTKQLIFDDVKMHIGYVFTNDNEILGYCCIIMGDEPAYKNIDGKWKTDRAYAVVHRMAFSKDARGKHLSKDAFNLIKELCLSNNIDAIRIDTQDDNVVMKHVLAREGFEYCGIIQFDGSPKIAYEWDR